MKTKIVLPVLALTIAIVINTKVKAQWSLTGNALSSTNQYLGSSNAYDLVFRTGAVERMRIINTSGNPNMPNGNINIGHIVNTNQSFLSKVTINPALSVNNVGDNLIGLSVAKQISASYSRAIFFIPHLSGGYNYLTQSGDCAMLWTDGGNGAPNSGGNRNLDAGLVIGPFTSDYSGIRITNTGSVGIGTPLISNPHGYKLAVNGLIGAKAVKVETASGAWPDYVFEKEYKLKTISELECFITTNKHLPNIPSACDVENNGVDLGNMDAKLLEKIEELSLYIIEQNKRIELLEKKVNAVK